MRHLVRFRGSIAGAGFASGDRVVVGIWRESPFGPFADVMWSRPDGTRVLIAEGAAGSFVGRHYRFDEVRREPVEVLWRAADPTWPRGRRASPAAGSRLSVKAGELSLALEVGRPGALSLLLRLRPGWLGGMRGWMALEDVLLRPLAGPLIGGAAGIRVRGWTAAGAREWYVLEDHRPVASGWGIAGDRDLGSVAVVDRRMGFGFSEFPARPAIVSVTSAFEAGTDALSEPG